MGKFYLGKESNLPKKADKDSIYVTNDTFQMYLSDSEGVLRQIDFSEEGTYDVYWETWVGDKTLKAGTYYSKSTRLEQIQNFCSLVIDREYEFPSTLHVDNGNYPYITTTHVIATLKNNNFTVNFKTSAGTLFTFIQIEELPDGSLGESYSKIFKIEIKLGIVVTEDIKMLIKTGINIFKLCLIDLSKFK